MLRKIISGGQTGADEAGVFVGRRFGLETGGMMPAGWRTLKGSRPDFEKLYGMTCHLSDKYPPRTAENVFHSDGTVRFAANFDTAGEVCTWKAILKYKKLYINIDLTDPPPVSCFTAWLRENKIGVLNVAGNSNETYADCFRGTVRYLTEAFFEMGLVAQISATEILEMLGYDAGYEIRSNSSPVDLLKVHKKSAVPT